MWIWNIKNHHFLAKMHGVKKISLFGSYAKATSTEKSDIDFYIDKGKITD